MVPPLGRHHADLLLVGQFQPVETRPDLVAETVEERGEGQHGMAGLQQLVIRFTAGCPDAPGLVSGGVPDELHERVLRAEQRERRTVGEGPSAQDPRADDLVGLGDARAARGQQS